MNPAATSHLAVNPTVINGPPARRAAGSLWGRLRSILGRARTTAPDGVKVGQDVCLRYARLQAEGANTIADGSKLSGDIRLGYATTVGRHAEFNGGTITLGRYCSLAPACAIYALNHPVTHLTTYVGKALWRAELKKLQTPEDVRIGHDVWIGHGAVILPGVTVGNGAILGAGAIVTKPVRNYAIVVGNPARELRRRFNDEIVSLLETLQWWRFLPDELREMEALFKIDFAQEPERGLECLRRFVKQPMNSGSRPPTGSA